MAVITGVILAGGRSTRMGTDKALLPFPGKTQMTFCSQLVATLTPLCEEVLLVARDSVQAANYTLSGVRIITDQRPDIGPLMGLYSGLAASSTTRALVIAVDTPFVSTALITWLLSYEAYAHDSLLVPRIQGVPQVLCALYPTSILPAIERRLREGRRDPRSLLEVLPVHFIEEAQLRQVDPQLRSFCNINTPEDLLHSTYGWADEA